jgi:nickel-type superoxide dismutase maturation protease
MTRLHLTHRNAAIDAGASLLTGLVLLLGWVRPRRFVVSGASMLPTLRPGDRLLVARLGRPQPGDLVVIRDPRAPTRLLCKRVVSRDARHIVVRGDNPDASTDSRAFGPVPDDWVVGRVLRRYWPMADARRF